MRLRLDGQSYSQTFETEKDAENWAYLIKAQHKTNQLKPVEQRTLRELIDEYIDSSQLSENTILSYRQVEKTFTQAMDKPFSQVKNWQRLVNMELEHLHPNTVAMRWTIICSVLRFHGLDIPQVKITKKPSALKNYLVPDEIKRFCDAVKGHKHEVYFLMMLHGLRVSEALHHTEATEDGMKVHGTKTEAAERFVPYMIPRLKEIIHDRPPTRKEALNAELEKICKEHNFPRLTCHSLRISTASLCYSLGIPERICMVFMGWKSVQVMHDVYIRISEDDVKRYAKQVEDFFH